jgi:hypothetical protein
MTFVKNEIWALSLIKAKWAAARGCFLVVAAFGVATGGLGGYVLGPCIRGICSMISDF